MKGKVWIPVSLVVLIGLCGAMIPWKELSQPSRTAVEDALRARCQEYAALRLRNDWDALYDLTVPAHREVIDKARFLALYGHGMLKTVQMDLVEAECDKPLYNTGKSKYDAATELVRDKLPPQARGVRVESADDLRRAGPFELEWQRVGGQWYFLMDQEIVSGRAGGQDIMTLDEQHQQDEKDN